MDEKKKTGMDNAGPALMIEGELGTFNGNSDLNG